MKRLIAITRPEFFKGEADLINSLFENGLKNLHIRKPDAGREETVSLLKHISPINFPQIIVHDHFNLVEEFGLGGININRRNPVVPKSFRGSVSRSCHTFSELADYKGLDYLFLSPIFSSISKSGYDGAFSVEQLQFAADKGFITDKVIALGGISSQTIPLIKEIPFGGYAVLGALWGKPPYTNADKNLREILKHLED